MRLARPAATPHPPLSPAATATSVAAVASAFRPIRVLTGLSRSVASDSPAFGLGTSPGPARQVADDGIPHRVRGREIPVRSHSRPAVPAFCGRPPAFLLARPLAGRCTRPVRRLAATDWTGPAGAGRGPPARGPGRPAPPRLAGRSPRPWAARCRGPHHLRHPTHPRRVRALVRGTTP